MKLTKHRVASGRDSHFFVNRVIAFRVRRSPGEMYSGHSRLYVCVCVSVYRRIPTLLRGPGCNLCTIGQIYNRCTGFVAKTA